MRMSMRPPPCPRLLPGLGVLAAFPCQQAAKDKADLNAEILRLRELLESERVRLQRELGATIAALEARSRSQHDCIRMDPHEYVPSTLCFVKTKARTYQAPGNNTLRLPNE